MFTNSWAILKRALLQEGYIESTFETYDAARLIIEQDFDKAKEKMKHEAVDRFKLDHMIQLSKEEGLTFVAISYPEIANFNIFYYKEKSVTIARLIKEVYNVNSNEIKYQTAHETIEMYENIKSMVDGEDDYDEISDELDLLYKVREFIEDSEEVKDNLKAILKSHRRAMEIELDRAKRKMKVCEFNKLRGERKQRYENMCEKLYTHTNLILNIHEN